MLLNLIFIPPKIIEESEYQLILKIDVEYYNVNCFFMKDGYPC